MSIKLSTAACLAATSIALATSAAAQPMELRAVMQDMSKNLQAVVDAISRADWNRAAESAARIVSHPQPSDAEKARIITFFGPDMGRFKALDSKSSDAAAQIERSARAARPQEVIDSVARLQTSCLECHQTFRERFINQFYQPDRITRRQ